jgi:hypothetical protein
MLSAAVEAGLRRRPQRNYRRLHSIPEGGSEDGLNR